MNDTKEAFWRKAGYKLFSIFTIRFVETILISIIPSVISVFLILISQDPNGRAWKIFQLLSFLVFTVGNCYFFVRFSLTGRRKREIYLINGITYGIYMLITFIAYKYSNDVMFCSLTFATLRGFEGFGARTVDSIKLSHSIILMLMVLCDLCARYYLGIKEKEEKEELLELQKNMEDLPEEVVIPRQNKKEVKFLSTEEMNDYIQQESGELEAAIASAVESMTEESFFKGRGDEIIYATDDDPEDDFDDGIYGNTNISDNSMYSSDSLWEEGIYQGRNTENTPTRVYAYEEDVPITETESVDEENDDDFESLPIGRINLMDEEEFYEGYDTYVKASEELPYTSDELWETGFYQGRNKNAVPDRIENFEDDDFMATEPIEVGDEPVNLWDDITQGGKSIKTGIDDESDVESYVESYFENYDSENLWDNIIQDDEMFVEDDEVEEDAESEANPYEDYDADSLWSADIHQGKKQ